MRQAVARQRERVGCQCRSRGAGCVESVVLAAQPSLAPRCAADLGHDLSAFGEVTEQTPASVQLKVPRAKVTETCRQLLEACDISDINVQEVPVEEVIRQLFGERHESHRSVDLATAEAAQVN